MLVNSEKLARWGILRILTQSLRTLNCLCGGRWPPGCPLVRLLNRFASETHNWEIFSSLKENEEQNYIFFWHTLKPGDTWENREVAPLFQSFCLLDFVDFGREGFLATRSPRSALTPGYWRKRWYRRQEIARKNHTDDKNVLSRWHQPHSLWQRARSMLSLWRKPSFVPPWGVRRRCAAWWPWPPEWKRKWFSFVWNRREEG